MLSIVNRKIVSEYSNEVYQNRHIWKQLGCHWDGVSKHWIIPDNVETESVWKPLTISMTRAKPAPKSYGRMR